MAHYRFIFSEEFLIEATRRYRRQLAWRRIFYGLKSVLAFLLLAFGTLLVVMAKWSLFVPFAIFAAVLFVGWPIDVWFMRRRFRNSPFHNDEIAITFSDEGLHVTGRSSDTRSSWSLVTKVRRFHDGFLLFQGPYVFHWLPDTAATDPTDVSGLEKLVRAHVQDVRDA